MAIALKTPKQRTDNCLSKRCNLHYDKATQIFECYKQFLPEFVAGKKILDIGCGFLGGLAKLVLEAGAESYTGVDINPYAIKGSRKEVPEGKFIWDDPIQVIKMLRAPHLMISSGVFDITILRNQDYIRELVRAIYEKTARNDYTINSADGFEAGFNRFFLEQGFRRVERKEVLTPQYFAIYQK